MMHRWRDERFSSYYNEFANKKAVDHPTNLFLANGLLIGLAGTT